MKYTPTFHFTDEPQFMTTMSRAEAANRLRSYRNRENGNARRFEVSRAPLGYFVRICAYGEPIAYIRTKGI